MIIVKPLLNRSLSMNANSSFGASRAPGARLVHVRAVAGYGHPATTDTSPRLLELFIAPGWEVLSRFGNVVMILLEDEAVAPGPTRLPSSVCHVHDLHRRRSVADVWLRSDRLRKLA